MIKMGKIKTKQIVVVVLIASFLLSCSKNIQTTPLSTDQKPEKKLTTPKKSLDEYLENQKLSSKLEPEDAFIEEAYEFYKKAKQSAKYPSSFDDYGTDDLTSIEFLEKATAIDAYYHAAYYVLGLCYSKTENYNMAEQCFLKSIKLKPKYQAGYNRLANIYKKQNRLDEALNYYNESLKAGPPDGAILSSIGEIYLIEGDLEKAETFYLKILTLEKGKEFYLDDVAFFYLKKENLKESWKYLKQSIFFCLFDETPEKRLKPYKQYLLDDNFYAHASSGFICYRCGNYKEAVEHFEKALKLNRSEFDQYYLLGMSYKEINNYKKTISYLEEAIKIDPNHFDTNLQLGIIYGYSSYVAYLNNTKTDYKRSLELLEKAKQINPKNQDPYLYLGQTYLQMKSYYDALRETRKALDIKKDAPALRQMGEIYYEMKDYKMSLEYLSKSLELSESYYVRILIIEALKVLKEYNEAIRFINESIDIYPKIDSLNQWLGDVYFEKEDYPTAILHYKNCLKKNPNNSSAHFNIALSKLCLKKYDESEWWWKKTIEMNPKEPAAFYNLGLVYLNTSKYEKAIKNFNKFLEFNPNYNDANSMIAICQYQIDLERFPEKLRKLSLRNDNIGELSCVLLCALNYNDANNLWIDGVKKTEYKDGQNIVSPKIFEAQGRFEKIKSDLEKISSPKGKTKKIIDSFLFAVEQRIKGIEQHSEGYYTTRGDYKGQYEKGKAKIRIADNYYVDCLKSLREEIINNKSIFGDVANNELKSSIEYYENKYSK
jgi:tetratricopeptide (TPR) repeat protein